MEAIDAATFNEWGIDYLKYGPYLHSYSKFCNLMYA